MSQKWKTKIMIVFDSLKTYLSREELLELFHDLYEELKKINKK